MREKALVAKAVDLVLALGQKTHALAPWGMMRRITSCGLFMLAGLLSSSAAAASTPVGWLDAANAGNNRRIQGWALDAAAPSSSIDVHIYFDLGTPQVRAYATATNGYRSDVNAAYGVSGNHGFDFLIPPELLDGVQHKVDAFAIDPHNTGNPLLAGCPKYFTNYANLPIGFLEAVDAGFNRRIQGWALAPGDPSLSITVHLFFDMGSPRERAYIVPTNGYRPDVNAAYGASGNHGFDFEIPSVLLDGVQHWVDVIAIDPHSTRTPLLTGCPKPFARSLSAAALISPSGNTYDASPVLVWYPAAGATRYWVQIDNVSDPGVGVAVYTAPFDSAQVCSGSSCTVATGTGLAQGPYRWNVEAQSSAGKTWSNGLDFTVLAPPGPVPVSPSGATTNPTPTFTWSKAAGATRYWLVVLDQAGVVALQGDSYPSGCSGSTCTWAPGKFFTAGSYTWKVEAQSAAGKTWGSTLGFTVVGPPAPGLVSPAGNTYEATPLFTWNASAGATQYWVQVDDLTNPGVPVAVFTGLYAAAQVCGTGAPGFPACALAPGKGLVAGPYRWNVEAQNAVGKTWGEARTFNVLTLPAPVPIAPSGAASSQPTYWWKPVPGATGYVLQVEDASGATVLHGYHSAAANCSASDCSVTPSGALDTLAGGVYRWSVLARNSAGDGAFSPGMRFFTPTWSGTKACRGVFLAADFNADGRTDQLCSHDGVTNVALSTGDGFATPVVWLDQQFGSPIVADFNGDGAADVAEYDGGGKAFWVALSSGNAFTSPAPWGTATAPWTDGQTYSCGGAARTGSGNFDGNGFTDVFCRGEGDGRIFVGKSTGSSFVFSMFADYMCGAAAERVGPADFDGDGRDDWYCIDGYGGLYGRLSNGHAFEDASFQFPGRGVCERDDWTFVDINADGKTDVSCRPNGYVGLSTGSAILDTGSSGNWCNFWETVTDPDNPETPPVEVLRSQMQPMDTNGDRIPELVCTFAGQYVRDVHMRKWNGETLGPVQGLADMWCKGAVQGGDFDGDGKFELVCDNGAVLRAGTPNVVPDLMVEAANGMGGRTTAGYGPSSSFGCNKPPVRQVVTGVATDDGRGGTATTAFTYCGGRTDPAEGMFLGYGQVQTTAPSLGGESTAPITTTLYSQELRSLGRPTLVRRADGAGKVLQETGTLFHPQSGPSLPRQALVKDVRTTDFGPSGGEAKTTSVSYTYDSYGNVTRQLSHGETAPDGSEIPNDELQTDMTYEPPDLTSYVVNRVRLTEVREQRGQGLVLLKRVENVLDPATFDLTSVKTSVLPGSGLLVRTMDYEAGNLTYVKSELGAETTITYTADGLHPETVTGPEGSVRTAWHPLCDMPTQVTDLNDPNRRTTTSYDELCRPERTDGPLGSFVERSYENLGDPNAQHVRVETPGSNGNDYSEQYFDGLGRTYRSLDRGPSPGQDIVTERSYNRRGGLASETAPFYAGDPPDVTRYAYDPFDRVVTITHPDDTTTTKSYGLWSETTTNAKGKPTTTQRSTTRSVETTTIEGQPAQTTTTYDRLGRRKTLDDGHQHAWTWSYDSLDRIVHQVDPDSGTKTATYDDTARTETQTDAIGQVLTVAYDTLGRAVTKTSAVGQATFRYGEPRGSYSNGGRLTAVSSPAGSGPPTTLQMDYDALGRVVKQSRSIPEAGWSGAVLKEYDAAGRMSGLQYPDGESIGRVLGVGAAFGYDGAGRLTSIPGILNSVTYDAAGRPLEQQNANGTVTTRTYVPKRGLLDTQVTTAPVSPTPIQNLGYGYDPDLPLVTSMRSPIAGESWDYGYDDGYRLITSTHMTNPADSQSFTYDALGRMTFNSRVGAYDYTDPAHPHAPGRVNGQTYTYDPNGNLQSGGGRSPVWDGENRISAIGTTSFRYDTFGERLMKTTAQGLLVSTTLYPFGDDYEIVNGITTKYVSVEGLGVIAKRVTGGPAPGTFWLHTDRLGSIQAVTDGAGSTVYRHTYRPYGQTLGETTGHTESRGWIDQRNDGETGLTYLHARYFDPKLGTFLSPDPIGVEGGLNQYGYALGNPVNGSDRSGLNMDWGLILCLMGLCQFEQIEVGPGGGGGGVPFELFFDRFAPNPILAQQPGPAQEPAPQEPAQDPPKEEPKQEPTPVPGLVGRPKSKYSGIHNAAMGDAFKRLDGRQCGDFYGGMGPQTMARTEYRFLPLGADVVAATPPPLTPGGPQLRVFVSSDGPFVNPPPMGEVKLPSGTSRFLGSPTAYRSFIYLHELGHQVKSVTGFVEDHDNPRLNSKHSLQVIDACY